MLTPRVDRLLADLALLGSLGDRGSVRLAQDCHHLFVGESALSHQLFLCVEEPSFQKPPVRKSRAGHRLRDLALFDLGIDSKLRTCDVVKLRVRDVCHGDRLAARARVLQQETQRPVQFEITPPTREALEA